MRRIYSLSDQGLADAPEQGSEAWPGRVGRITGSKPSDLYFNFKEESDWDILLGNGLETVTKNLMTCPNQGWHGVKT